MSILITGCAGFIGFNLCDYLLSKNFTVTGIDNYFSGSKENTKILKKKYKQNFKFFKVDIRTEEIAKYLKGIHTVINLAGQVSVQKSIENPMETDSINSQGFINLVNHSYSNDVKNFIYASSCAVYGDCKKLPLNEMLELEPLSPYAASKISNENYASTFSALHKQISFIGLRFFNVVGPFQSIDSDYGAVIPNWIRLFLNNTQPIIYGNGLATRDFVDVLDISKIIEKIIKNRKFYKNEIFNIGSGNKKKIKDLYEVIQKIMKKKKVDYSFNAPLYQKKRDGDIKDSYSNIKKLKKEFKYENFLDIEESISRILESQYLIK